MGDMRRLHAAKDGEHNTLLAALAIPAQLIFTQFDELKLKDKEAWALLCDKFYVVDATCTNRFKRVNEYYLNINRALCDARAAVTDGLRNQHARDIEGLSSLLIELTGFSDGPKRTLEQVVKMKGNKPSLENVGLLAIVKNDLDPAVSTYKDARAKYAQEVDAIYNSACVFSDPGTQLTSWSLQDVAICGKMCAWMLDKGGASATLAKWFLDIGFKKAISIFHLYVKFYIISKHLIRNNSQVTLTHPTISACASQGD